MKGKNFLILGANSGIGLEIARRLTDAGATVYGTSRGEANEAEKLGVKGIKLDVLENLNGELDSLPDTLHGVAYAVGTITLKPFQALKPEDFIRDYQLNVIGAVKVLQAVQKKLLKAENASVVLFSTVAARVGMSFHASIAAAKGAIEGLSKALAAEWSNKGIRVNVVAPSLVETPLAENLLNNEDKREAGKKRHPLGRYGQPKDIASAVVYLLSEESSWVTGQTFGVDGGLSTLRPI